MQSMTPHYQMVCLLLAFIRLYYHYPIFCKLYIYYLLFSLSLFFIIYINRKDTLVWVVKGSLQGIKCFLHPLPRHLLLLVVQFCLTRHSMAITYTTRLKEHTVVFTHQSH